MCFADDVQMGTWKLNEAKSKLAPGVPKNRPPRRTSPPDQVRTRADRIIARAQSAGGKVALFAHGHILRVLAVRWIGLRVQDGQHFLLSTGTVSVLAYYEDAPAIGLWNASPDLVSQGR